MKDQAKDLALRVTHGYQIDILCQSCLFYNEAKKCTTPLPMQYQAVEPGKGMVDCSNYLMSLYKPGRGTSEASYSDRLVNLWINRSQVPNMTIGKMRPDKQQAVENAKRKYPNLGFEKLSLELGKKYIQMKGVPTRSLKLRHSMAKYLLRLVMEGRRRMEHYWYVNALEPIMSHYLESELRRLMKKMEGK